MNIEFAGLLFTLFLGIFILIGSLITFFAKNNDKFVKFSIGIAFGVMVMLIIFDLLPEVYSIFSLKYDAFVSGLIILGLSLFGVGLLKLFDLFIPDHDHSLSNEDNHLHHIGVVSSVALILHNIIEGMAIYGVFINSIYTGILLSIGVGLHNIPLGMIVASTFYKSNKSMKKTLFISLGISISTFIGGLVMYFLSSVISEVMVGVLLAITLGMIIYIVLFELLPHIILTRDKKNSIYGILSGVLIIIISLVLHLID